MAVAQTSEHDPPDALTPERLCDLYATRIYQFAAMVCRGEAEAEDLAQEALVRAITHLDRYDSTRGPIEPWLWRIVANVARDAGRFAGRRHALFQRLTARYSASMEIEDNFVNRLADDDLLVTIRSLPPRSRALIALRFGADLDFAGVGSALGISPAAARVATNRAIQDLRRRLHALEESH